MKFFFSDWNMQMPPQLAEYLYVTDVCLIVKTGFLCENLILLLLKLLIVLLKIFQF